MLHIYTWAEPMGRTHGSNPWVEPMGRPMGRTYVIIKTKQTRSPRTIIFVAVSRRDLCYVSENENFPDPGIPDPRILDPGFLDPGFPGKSRIRSRARRPGGGYLYFNFYSKALLAGFEAE